MKKQLLFTLLAFTLLSSTTFAATKTWNGSVSTAWQTAGNWTGGVPVLNDDIIIPNTTNKPIYNNASYSAVNTIQVTVGHTMTIQNGASLSIIATSGDIQGILVQGSLTISSGGTLTLTGSAAFLSYLDIAGGSVTNSGTLNLNTKGNIYLNFAAATFTCSGGTINNNGGVIDGTGTYTGCLYTNSSTGTIFTTSTDCISFNSGLTNNGTIAFFVDGTTPCSQHNQITVTGNTTLTGAIEVTTALSIGSTEYTLLTSTGDITGTGFPRAILLSTGKYANLRIDNTTSPRTLKLKIESSAVLACTTPTAYTVTGTGAYCAGGAGVAVGLSNSETGITYQLKNGGANVGLAVSGTTGSAITFGNQTTAATYTVVATRTSGSCTNTMTGSAVVSITPTVTPSVSITANPSGSITAGTSVTFTAAPTNGGAAPAYQWKKGMATVGTNSNMYTNAALANNDAISCVMTSNATCPSPATGTSNTINMTVTAVLPIELLDFSSKNTEGGNLLTWTTANEVNNKGFAVERLMANREWSTLGFVNTKGKAATYNFTDKDPLSISYYRLRQLDNDGKETLSKVVSILLKKSDKLKVYPNPVAHILTVETDNTRDFRIINVLGQIVISGQAAQRINVSVLPQGTYVLKIGVEQVKFVKQ
jgi:hypothetical protein